MALVIMGHGGRAALLERQSRMGSVERLDLQFFIDPENGGSLVRIKLEAIDHGHPLVQHRVVRNLESGHQLQLQPASAEMRPTLDGEMPIASAIRDRLPCMALGGASRTVFVITLRRVARGSGGTREGRVLSRRSPGTPSSR